MKKPATGARDFSQPHYDAIADKIEAQPALLEIPLSNIERWLSQDHSAPHRLEQWRAIILEAQASEQGMKNLLFILRDQSEEAIHLRSFDVFPGILSPDERRRLIAQCAFSH